MVELTSPNINVIKTWWTVDGNFNAYTFDGHNNWYNALLYIPFIDQGKSWSDV